MNEEVNILAGVEKMNFGASGGILHVVQQAIDVSWQLALAFRAWSTLLACATLQTLSMMETNKCVMKRRRQKSNTWRLGLMIHSKSIARGATEWSSEGLVDFT